MFVCLFVCLIVCLCGCHVAIASLSFIFVSMYLPLFMFLWVGIRYYNFSIILVWFNSFLETDILAYNLVLFIYFVLLFVDLLFHAYIIMYIFLLPFVVLIIYVDIFCCPMQHDFFIAHFFFANMVIMMLLMLHFIYICFYIHACTCLVLKC